MGRGGGGVVEWYYKYRLLNDFIYFTSNIALHDLYLHTLYTIVTNTTINTTINTTTNRPVRRGYRDARAQTRAHGHDLGSYGHVRSPCGG